jgi:hypothetical protein
MSWGARSSRRYRPWASDLNVDAVEAVGAQSNSQFEWREVAPSPGIAASSIHLNASGYFERATFPDLHDVHGHREGRCGS